MTLTDYCDRVIVGKFNATVVGASSDDRLKFNEVDIQNGLQMINQLSPKIYDKSKILNIEENTFKEAGVVAQEVLNTDLSFCVSGGDTTDFLGNLLENPYIVNYNDIFTYGLAATKELDAIVQTQQTGISTLQQENTDLSNNLNLSNQKITTLETTIETLKTALNELLSDAGKSTI
jgi:hypothetical protein